MNLIYIDLIHIPENRIRREFPDNKEIELADSIWRLGLLQPVVLHDDSKTLLCGERRLRAVRRLREDKKLRDALTEEHGAAHRFTEELLSQHSIPYILRSDLNAHERQLAELEENTRRLDLTWQEQSLASKRLHELRQGEHGAGGTGRPGWSIKDTAEEIAGREPTSHERKMISEDLLLAEFLEDEEFSDILAAAPDKKEALRTVRTLKEAKARRERAESIDPASIKHTVLLGDAYELLDSPQWLGTFDVIVCDPPYGRDMHKHRFSSRHEYDDSHTAFENFLSDFLPLSFLLAKPQAHIYVFCDYAFYEKTWLALETSGWNVWRWPLVWDKGNVGTFGNAEQGPRHCYDIIAYAHKGKKPCTAMYRDVIPINQLTALDHPAGKPAELYVDLLRRSVLPGDRVLDPMVGGGTFFTACTQLKATGVGVESNEKYYYMALERAAGEKK